MCGRYRLSRRAEILASHFYAEYEGMDWEARYNIASHPLPRVAIFREHLKSDLLNVIVGSEPPFPHHNVISVLRHRQALTLRSLGGFRTKGKGKSNECGEENMAPPKVPHGRKRTHSHHLVTRKHRQLQLDDTFMP
jgi:hypothetical protein